MIEIKINANSKTIQNLVKSKKLDLAKSKMSNLA